MIIGPAGSPQRTPAAGVAGTSYLSPTYGYRLTWEAAWQVRDVSSANGVDQLQLSNGPSYVVVTGHPAPIADPAACLASMVQSRKDDPGHVNLQQATGADGAPLQGSDSTGAYAIYVFGSKAQDGAVTQYAEYMACKTLLPQTAVLEISDLVLLNDFIAQVSALETLLAGLILPNAGGAPVLTPPAPPTVIPAATATSSVCAGIDEWFTATSANLKQADTILDDMKNWRSQGTTDVLSLWARWQTQWSQLADAQAGIPAPDAAAHANLALIDAFRAYSGAFGRSINDAVAGDFSQTTLQVEQKAYLDADAALGSARGEVKTLGTQCGLKA